jgi:hypothetical protein
LIPVWVPLSHWEGEKRDGKHWGGLLPGGVHVSETRRMRNRLSVGNIQLEFPDRRNNSALSQGYE